MVLIPCIKFCIYLFIKHCIKPKLTVLAFVKLLCRADKQPRIYDDDGDQTSIILKQKNNSSKTRVFSKQKASIKHLHRNWSGFY